MKMLIDAAKAGKSTLETRVYDGSEKARKAYDTFAVIGKAADTTAEVEEPLRTSGWDKCPAGPCRSAISRRAATPSSRST